MTRITALLFRCIRLLLVPAYIAVSFSALGQSTNRYLPQDTSAVFARLAAIEGAAISALPAGTSDAVLEIYRERTEDLKEAILDESFVFDPELQAFVEGTYERLINANNLPVRPLIFVSRSAAVNAASLGDGLFVINLGLLRRLNSEDELASVYAHELAHDQLAHLAEKVEFLALHREEAPDDRRSRRALRRKLRQEGKKKMMSDLRDLLYLQRRHGRANELAADSLGTVYLLASGYAPLAAARSLEMLRDNDAYVLPEGTLAEQLTTSTYPFKEKWIAPPATMFGGSFGAAESDDAAQAFWERDSLASHPNLEERVAGAYQRLVAAESDTSAATAVWPAHAMGERSRREIVLHFLDNRMSAHALILSLAALAEETEAPFYRAAVGRALLETYRSVADHNFDRHIPPTGHFTDEQAQSAVRLLHQIRNSELKKLTLAYLEDQVAHFPEDPMLRGLLDEATDFFASTDH